MSDMSQGPGWWIASDGKWYPPQEHPDRASMPDPGSGAPVSRWRGSMHAGDADADAAPGSVVSGSVVSGSGVLSQSTAAAAWRDESTEVGPQQSDGRSPLIMTTGAGEVFDPRIHVREARSLRFWILGAVVLVALAVAAVVVAVQSPAPTGATLSAGPTTASLVVTLPRGGQPSFSGTLAGRPLTGVISGKGESISTNGGPIAEYRGTLGSVPFDLHVSIKPFLSGQISFGVTGTYGSEPVTATARFGLTSSSARSLTVPFDGHVGSQEITGVATAAPTPGNGVQIRATLSVLSPSV